jgi:hypothetical protein
MRFGAKAVTRGVVTTFAAVTLVVTAATPAFAAAPTIISFTPTGGPAGTLVSVTGTGFTGGTAGVTSVTFNGVGTTFNVLDDQHLSATVPIGATTGKIAATTSEGTGMSAANFVVSAQPTISGFTPTSGSPGTAVTVNGSNFTGVNAVRFNGVSATFNFVSDGQVNTTVPVGATTGRITVTTGAGTATSSSNFTVTTGNAPTISSFSPSSGNVGTSVTINGNNFTGVNAVRFNGVSASWTFVNDDRVTATVPSGATTGRITVTTGAGTATSSSNFTVTTGNAPTISSFSPSSGNVGTSVTINGNRFTGVTSVRFNGVSANYSFVNDDRVIATVPPGATTGRISVTTPGGTGTSSSDFTVVGGGGGHERSVSLSVSHRHASGHVSVDDGYSACASYVPVVIKRLRHGDWRWVTTTSTDGGGDYRAFIGRSRGEFRARAKRIVLVNGAICEGDRSHATHRGLRFG